MYFVNCRKVDLPVISVVSLTDQRLELSTDIEHGVYFERYLLNRCDLSSRKNSSIPRGYWSKQQLKKINKNNSAVSTDCNIFFSTKFLLQMKIRVKIVTENCSTGCCFKQKKCATIIPLSLVTTSDVCVTKKQWRILLHSLYKNEHWTFRV